MTSLLLHWLNEELTLHRKVDVLERDLCNGYIMAEILHLHGLEGHLERYADDGDLSTRVTNLELLGKAMAAGGLGELKASTKREILMESRSVILQLLLHMKETLEARGKKISTEKQKLSNVSSRVYEPRSPVKDPARVIQDVEERFVKETYKQYQPKEVRFYKDINSVVHLRKFPQAQWQAENEQLEHEETMASDKAQQSSNGMAALRVHLNEKRAFMKDWDQQRLEKWQHTQKLYQDAERDDLRLELTLEERKRRFHEAKLAEIQADAKEGVVGFDKNMNRLGLGGNNGGGSEPPLRAIPSSDPGALAHFHRLEQQVENLAFRPSNNVQMMKELRARRKAQLAAEKDRRLRRMKAVSDATKAAAEISKGAVGSSGPANEEEMVTSVNGEQENRETLTKPIVIQDAFIEANREILEANYTRLRELGTTKREGDNAELQRIRLEKRSKAYLKSKADCLEIVDDLIAVTIARTERDSNGDEVALREWKSALWSEQTASKHTTTADELNSEHDEDEVRNLTDTFLGLSGVWETCLGISDDDSSCERSQSAPVSSRIEEFIRSALVTSPEEMLSTIWTPLKDFQLVSVYSSDERGHAVARRVALDQSLHYVNVDELLDECVSCSYDPVKQADIATTLGDRERDLGAFGPKITALRQKSSPIPDSLVVDVVVATVALCQPKNTAPTDVECVDDSASPAEEGVGSDGAAVIEPRESPRRMGCLLHNFPKTVDEWKLFERLMDANSQSQTDDEAKAARASSLEAALAGETGQYASNIAAAIVISQWQPPQPTPTPVLLSPSSSGSELPSSAAERKRTESTSSKRQVVVDPAIAIAEAELEALEKRQLVEDLFSKTSRIVKIDQAEMHERVLQELVHLSIDVYAIESARQRVGVAIECPPCINLPDAIHRAREERRSSMPLGVRIAWMVATKELALNEQSLMEFVLRLQHLEDVRATNLRRLFGIALEVLKRITRTGRSKQRELDQILSQIAPQCELTLEKADKMLQSKSSKSEKALTAVEVELGDAIDHRRLIAHRFIDEVEEEGKSETPPILSLVAPWLQVLPRVCLELKEFVVDVVNLLRTDFYEQFSFLRSDAREVFPVGLECHVLKTIEAAVEDIDRACADRGLRYSLLPEVWRLVDQIATTRNTDMTPHSPLYDLAERAIARDLVIHALRRCDAVLRWSAALVVNVQATYASDVKSMREYVSREVQTSNRTVTRVIKHLATTGSAKWPQLSSGLDVSMMPRSRPSVSRHHQAAFLSTAQLETLVAELRRVEDASGSHLMSLSREQFVATAFDVATRYGFPQPWLDTESLARVAMVWSSASQGSRVPWRRIIFALICTQFTGFPSVQDVCSFANQAGKPADSLTDQTITLDDFHLRVTLWFETDSSSRGPTARWKTLLMSLVAENSSSCTASVMALALLLCISPAHPSEIRADLASSTLPGSSRGLSRAFAVLSRCQSGERASEVGVTELTQFVRLAQVDVDSDLLSSAASIHRGGTDGDCRPWRAHESRDFLSFCDAYDPSIAHHFTVHDTFAALLNEDMV